MTTNMKPRKDAIMVVRRKYVTARRPTAPDKETFREPTAVIREGTMSGMISALSIRRKSFPTTETYMTSLCVQCSFSWWSTKPKQTPAKTPTANCEWLLHLKVQKQSTQINTNPRWRGQVLRSWRNFESWSRLPLSPKSLPRALKHDNSNYSFPSMLKERMPTLNRV